MASRCARLWHGSVKTNFQPRLCDPFQPMKKLLFTLLAIVATVITTQAQTSLVATLSHEGKTSAYYGAEALVNAAAAAENGDVITLSSGTFKGATIAKSITVRGAGMSVGDDGSLPTVISSNMIASVDNITLEGLYVNATLFINGWTNSNDMFIKCRFTYVATSGSGNAYNMRFIHCRIANGTQFYDNSSATFVNSIICKPNGSCLYNFLNCVILFTQGNNQGGYGVSPSAIVNSSLTNCFVYSVGTNGFPKSTTPAYNVGSKEVLWNNSTLASNAVVEDFTTLFKDFTGEYGDDVTFKLTATGAAYLGSDGTQVGIYGGSLPFDPTPTNPRITKAQVAGQSSANGKLSIELEVNGANH